jgi:nitrogen PTS system EIIA component
MIATGSQGDFDFPEVRLPTEAKTNDAIVRFLLNELIRLKELLPEHSESVLLQVMRRESLGSTAIGRGVAIPHAQSNLVERVLGIVGVCTESVAWPSTPGVNEVQRVCLLITPSSYPGDGLRAIESVAKHFWQNNQ